MNHQFWDGVGVGLLGVMFVWNLWQRRRRLRAEERAYEARIVADAAALRQRREDLKDQPDICKRCCLRPIAEGCTMCTWCGI